MSREPEGALPELESLSRGKITYLPVAPGRMEFAIEVRRAILLNRPDVVAVELPEILERHYRAAVSRLPEISVMVYPEQDDDEQGIYVPVEPADPFTEAIRTALEVESEVLFLLPNIAERPHLSDAYPDPYSLRHVPLARYVEAYRVWPQQRTEEVTAHAAGIAWRLQGANPDLRILVVLSLNLLDPVLDAMETPQEEPRDLLKTAEVDLVNAHPDCLAEITVEYPYLQERYENFRRIMGPDVLIDRPRAQLALLKDAELDYQKETGENLVHWQRRMLARYTRNLAMINRDLTASLFDITVAARSIVDDNYGWSVWKTAGEYAHQREVSPLETVRIRGSEVWIRTRKLKIRRRLPRPKQRLKPASLREHKREETPGDWARQLDGNSICSYPPEDIVIEEYGTQLQQKAKSILSEERLRVEPFLHSILDGIDVRETIRHWMDGRIFVRNMRKMSGEVGAVIVIFDPDPDYRYRYLTTWLGEHQNESDMAFYSTPPFEHMVGPGVGRAEYGGLLMTRPPLRMRDVWSDPDYDFAETKPERLLMAGLDYSVSRYVVYVAAKPPRSIFRSIAAHLNRRIIYVPIGQLSSEKLKKLRVVHVLDGHHRRETAKDFIW
ncbi:MAG: hypothetical protein FJW20_03140 [Acidimicrobiia bacterium]|nr:hypothetical protein [Acidimicrobiia bacterium]